MLEEGETSERHTKPDSLEELTGFGTGTGCPYHRSCDTDSSSGGMLYLAYYGCDRPVKAIEQFGQYYY